MPKSSQAPPKSPGDAPTKAKASRPPTPAQPGQLDALSHRPLKRNIFHPKKYAP